MTIHALVLVAALLSSESDYRDHICGAAGWQMEVRMSNGTKADCLSETHAIEIDWTYKYAEAIGQSLNYASVTGKQPGIILICKRGTERKCLKWSLLLEETIAAWKLPITVWLCGADARRLDDCTRKEPTT
jgi:hypothetical protein